MQIYRVFNTPEKYIKRFKCQYLKLLNATQSDKQGQGLFKRHYLTAFVTGMADKLS